MKEFTNKVKNIVKNIPKGETLTYKDVAIQAGNDKAARAVANIMSANFDPEIPCHRVVRGNGKIGGYNRGGESAKRKLLISEGAIIKNNYGG